ncbi:MAG TPA: hypothetical protein VG056_17420 [Pirellulales bacterium]|nr:hypothetical protein [Pirellulales bacterium]
MTGSSGVLTTADDRFLRLQGLPNMDFNRNQFLMFGVIVLLLGIQFRTFDSFTLSEKATKFIATRMQEAGAAAAPAVPLAGPVPRKVLRPPQWLGWSLISVGSVLILHSFGMKKPGG